MYNISFFQILVVIFLLFLIFGDTKKFFSNVKDFKESIFNKKK
jgi:Sec-independent protein translocase protein TatA